VSGKLVAWGLFLLLLVWLLARVGRPGSRRSPYRPGPGAIGGVYGLLNEDKRKAVELIVEEKTAAKDPETADDKPEPGPRERT
jgi:hypothetical protein